MQSQSVFVSTLEDLAIKGSRIFSIDGFEVGVFNVNNRVVAYANRCPHAGGPVCQGKLMKRIGEEITADGCSAGFVFASERHVVCPWHGYEFDLETGQHPADPAMRLIPVSVEVRDQGVYVQVPERRQRA